MTSNYIKYKVCEYENYGHYARMYSILQKENGSITKTNKVIVDDGEEEKEVDFDDIGSFHYLNKQFYICPKGRYHLFDYNNKKYIIPKENFEEGEKFKIKCNYHEKSATFLVFYLMNEKNYLYRIYIGNGASIENIKRAEIVGSQLYDFKLSANLISGQEAAYHMLALNRQGNNIILSHIDATLWKKDNEPYDQSFSQTGGIKYIGNAMDNTQSYFKVSDSDNYMDIYYISYSDINNFYSGYSTKGPSYSDVTSTEINSSKVSFEFYEDVEIEEMNFMPYNRYVYYKMKLKGTSITKYYGIYDTKLFKVIFNTEEYIKYYIPSSSTEMLAITDTAAYKICAMKNNGDCVDYCSNNYLLDTEINQCTDSLTCPDGKIMLVPSGVCNETCDENIYHLEGTECGLCQYFYPNGNKYKLIGSKECIELIPNNTEIYNEKYNLLKCKEGYKIEGNECVPIEHCYQNCLNCTEYSEDPLNQNCTQCKSEFLLENENCVTLCSNGYEQKDNTCSSCEDETCKNFVNNSCDCIECKFHYYLNESKCYKCDDNCGDCSIIPTNCITCLPPKYLYNTICYECVDDDKCEIKGEDNCKCLTCKEGFYNSNYQCEECINHCKKCSNSNECEMCLDGYFVNSKRTCTACPKNCKKRKSDNCQCEICEDNYFMNKTQQCEKCNDLCKTCTDNADKCLSCNDHYFLVDDNKCEECDSNCEKCSGDKKYCTSCSIGKYLTDENKCEKCSDICLTCSSGESNEIQNCLSCDINSEYKYLIYDDYNKTCVKDCASNEREVNPDKPYECLPLTKNNETIPEDEENTDTENEIERERETKTETEREAETMDEKEKEKEKGKEKEKEKENEKEKGKETKKETEKEFEKEKELEIQAETETEIETGEEPKKTDKVTDSVIEEEIEKEIKKEVEETEKDEEIEKEKETDIAIDNNRGGNSTQPNKDGEKEKEKENDSSYLVAILVPIACVLLIIIIIVAIFLYKKYKNKKYDTISEDFAVELSGKNEIIE